MKSDEDVELPIGGMMSAACARTVAKVSINFAAKIASVSYNPAQNRIPDLGV
jgi:adenine deaminase